MTLKTHRKTSAAQIWANEQSDQGQRKQRPIETITPEEALRMITSGDETDDDGEEDLGDTPHVIITGAQPRPGSGSSSEMANWKRLEPILGKPVPMLSHLPDLTFAEQTLSRKFPWFEGANDIVLEAIALAHMSKRAPQLPSMLLYGAPGCGKTEYARTLADLFQSPLTLLPIAGAADDCGISATDRRWSTSQPSLPVRRILATGRADQIICIDELDKGSPLNSNNGSAQGSLMQMLSARSDYFDMFVAAPVDLRSVTFIATANTLGPIIQPLLDRMLLVECSPPKPKHFDAILDSCLDRFATEFGIEAGMLTLEPEDRDIILSALRGMQRPSIRSIAKLIQRVLANDARMMMRQRVLH